MVLCSVFCRRSCVKACVHSAPTGGAAADVVIALSLGGAEASITRGPGNEAPMSLRVHPCDVLLQRVVREIVKGGWRGVLVEVQVLRPWVPRPGPT